MAELVKLNMEQMLPFLDELKNFIPHDKLKQLVNKIQQHEYKIASKLRRFEDFKSYIDYIVKYHEQIRAMRLAESKSILIHVKALAKRLLKQITIHFQSEPKAFLLAIIVSRKFNNIDLEIFYWGQLLLKHGQKTVKFYLCAVDNYMNKIFPTMEEKHKSKKSNKHSQFADTIQKSGEEQAEVEAEERRRFSELMVTHMVRARVFFEQAMVAYPRSPELLLRYLRFEATVCQAQAAAEDACYRELGQCADGRAVDIVLRRVLALFPTRQHLSEAVLIAESGLPAEVALPTLATLRAKLHEVSLATVTGEADMEVVESAAPVVDATEDRYDAFVAKYREPRDLRAKDPRRAGGAVVKDLADYLEALGNRLCSGAASKAEEMPRVRALLDFVLSCDDWSSMAVDVWWQYYLLEQLHGDCVKAGAVLQRAEDRLRDSGALATLAMRRLKARLGR